MTTKNNTPALRLARKAKLTPIIEQGWVNGTSVSDMAVKLSVSEHYIRGVLIARWPERRDRDAARASAVPPVLHWSEPMVESLKSLVRCKLFNQDEVAEALTKEFGVSVTTAHVHAQLGKLRANGAPGMKLHNPWR